MKIITELLDMLRYPGKRRMVRSIKKMGNDCVICGPVKIIGGDYIEIGDGFYCGVDCRIEAWDKYNDKKYVPEISIGKNVRINSKCHIGAINKIEIGNNVLMGSNVFITDHSHGNISCEENVICPADRDLFSKGAVIIEENVWICENVAILPNVHIGKGAIIGAGAIVTKDVPAFCVVGGNPAHILKVIE